MALCQGAALFKMIFLFKDKPRDYNLSHLRPKIQTIEELCSGKNANVKAILEKNKQERIQHSYGSRGYTAKKNRRHIMRYPIDVLFHPELKKYFDSAMDAHERKKARLAFSRRTNGVFNVVEKI